MRIASITRSRGEAKTYRILDDTLYRRGYKILASVRLQDVLRADGGDRLDSYSTALFFRTAHFDFVVCRMMAADLLPLFAVEFDGPQHDTDPEQRRRDKMKNALCVRAQLPLIRITSEQIVDHERVSLLAHMLERFIAWGREYDDIWKDCLTRLQQLPADDPILKEMNEGPIAILDPEYDPSFWFDIRHPYPPTLTLQKRLAKRGVFTLRTMTEHKQYVEARRVEHIYMIHDISRSGNATSRERWSVETAAHLCRQSVSLRNSFRTTWEGVEATPASHIQTLYSSRQTASLKWACPTGIVKKNRLGAYEELSFCDLPGVHIPDIAEQLAEYLALRDVERWLDQPAARDN